MKYTDGMFPIPIRVYDGVSLKRARRLEEEEDIVGDGDWVEGIAKIPFNEIEGFVDYFSVGRSPKEVAKEGFDCCLVMTKTYGDFMCNETRKSVESRLNDFAERWEKRVEDEAIASLDRKEMVIAERKPKKKGIFRKFFAIL